MKKIRIVACIVLIAMLSTILSGCLAKVDIPEIKEGRFDFSVTCEINGEEKTFSGVYVCKYDGAYKTLLGEGVDWEGYIENSDENGIIILKAQKIMNAKGSMKLTGVNDSIMEVFDITGFLDILTIE